MNKESEMRLLELLSDEATFGLNAEERTEMGKLKKKHPEFANDFSFEAAAAAFQIASLDQTEEMPDFLKNRIADQADDIWRERFGNRQSEAIAVDEEQDQPKTAFLQWLGWAVAAAACAALVANIWFAVPRGSEIADDDRPVKTEEKVPTLAEKREALLASSSPIRTSWESPDKSLNVEGDVVWSDSKQEGYMRFRGLPANDKSKEAYQLWIFDETQDEATPIDGGVFDVNEDGEVIVPIDANLRVKGPKAFAVTVEKPGGVVVSKREKVVALAKVI
ncbi:MAG: anti-sigma factor [Acidobacteriota bacterium]|nr:anti-sigma factor [Acidobacteriota bacterium]MDH3529207.1 anti-sigma factor [Acidobacteriota bacterium]